ncbi:hypothetical protein BH09ACT8_BH09ACT8_60910 [soil metagenome]
MLEIDERVMVEEVKRRLADSHTDVSADRIDSVVQSAYGQFAHSPIRDFIPLFVERRARAQLSED